MAAKTLEDLSSESLVLAFDYGLARIGVASGNLMTRSASPVSIISWKTNEQKWKAVENIIREWAPEALIVGIPLYPDGAPNSMTGTCKKFANQLEGRFGLPVFRVDERYSSVEAEGNLRRSGAKGEILRVDDTAACIILEQWLASAEPEAAPR